jgi:hypothetical protein
MNADFGPNVAPLVPTATPFDPVAYIQSLNSLVAQAVQPLAAAPPGWLQLWDASSGNLLLQYSVPAIDALAPAPIFTFNSAASTFAIGSLQRAQVFHNGWFMSFLDFVTGSGTTAVVTKGTGATFGYSGKNAQGLFTASFGTVNQLQANADNTLTETQRPSPMATGTTTTAAEHWRASSAPATPGPWSTPERPRSSRPSSIPRLAAW